MEKKISVTRETRDEIMDSFRVTNVMVWKALTYESDSDLARRIRRLALLKGGVVMNLLPECETIHDSEGMLRQTFGNGAHIEINKKDGKAVLYDKTGNERLIQTNISIPQLEIMQAYAAELRD